jgi:hypothetical protein
MALILRNPFKAKKFVIIRSIVNSSKSNLPRGISYTVGSGGFNGSFKNYRGVGQERLKENITDLSE